ncbi:MAG: GNAT family N-acetyltransferase [Sedimentitalea sp.]
MLANGTFDIPPGKGAVITTYLEMTTKPPARPAVLPEGVTIASLPEPDFDSYRALFLRVGGMPSLWASRLELSEPELMAILRHRDVHNYTLMQDDTPQAMLELDFSLTGACEITFFGVAPHLTGTTAARCLMTEAITQAWARPIAKLHLHTCTHDHPAALAFYQRSGFEPVRQSVDVFDDPRISGVLPRDAVPRVPIFE